MAYGYGSMEATVPRNGSSRSSSPSDRSISPNLNPKILLENSIIPEMERTSSHSIQDREEFTEPQSVLNMSLEQPRAETMRDTSLNTEDQEELKKALTTVTLPSEEVDEADAQLHHSTKLGQPMSQIMKVDELDNTALQLAMSFQQSGEISQIENAVQLWKQAVELTPDGHAYKSRLLNNLGNAYQLQFNHLGELSDIESAIVALKQAIELTPDGHADKPPRLSSLSIAYWSQFGHLGDLRDIEHIIGALNKAVELTPDGHANKSNLLNDLGSAYQSRFDHLGELSDIASAIVALRQACELTPDGHANKPLWLSSLGIAYQSQFSHLGDPSDIECAIVALKQAVELTPNGHTYKSGWLNNLGNAYRLRFRHRGDLSDIANAIAALKEATELTPDDHADKPPWLSNLGGAYQLRFGRLGDLSDIEHAIVALKQAVELTPDGHTNKSGMLNNLGDAYRSRFGHLGDLNDIEHAIEALNQAVELTPDGHANKSSLLNNLGNAYRSRFGHLGELSNIESAIVALTQAVKLTPDGHASKSSRLNTLGSAYRSKFGHLGELSDIDSAIVALKHAIELAPDGYADKTLWLGDLGSAYHSRFGHLGELNDLEIKSSHLNNLGNAYRSRFGHLGELRDIDSAIVVIKQAIGLSPDGHVDKPLHLSNLGSTYQSRFGYLGDLSDIESAIVALKQAVELTPDGHTYKSGWLNNLGIAYKSRFGHLEELIKLTPDSHADRPSRFNNLGLAYHSRFHHLREPGDIQNAIVALKQAIELTVNGHVNKSGLLSNLGNAYQSRFSHMGDHSDIESAILANKQAVEITPDGHADKPRRLSSLGTAFQASLLSSGNPHVQLEAAIRWSRVCVTPASAVQAYSRFFELIPQVIWFGQTVSRRYKELPHIGRVVGAAAASAISAENLPLAVEWLDEGRSIIWGQILQLQSPLDDLYHKHPQIAKELEMVAQALQNAGTSLQNGFVDSGIKEATVEEEAQKHRRLADRYKDFIIQIRGLDGFASFMRPKRFSELALAATATHGPIVTVNVDEHQCDALIICSPEAIIHVPLPTFSLKQAQQLHLKLVSSLHSNGVRIERNGDRATRPASGDNHDHFALILKVLWLNVVQPILSKIENVLHESTQDTIPHITWCPTGPLTLLPLHAAGIYGSTTERNINISDFVVSSYTTTLRALIISAPKFKKPEAKIPNVLIVSQPNTPGLSPLPGTVEEAKVIQKHTSSTHTCHLNHDAATAKAVMHEMSKYDFIHFACHGIQDIQDPLDSAFALYDQRLTLKALMSLSLNNVQLAFLSACQTATGDENLPEEAVHLAAGMLAVGYPSVIATLWSIGDKEAPLIADKVYANLLGHHDDSGKKKSKMTPAYALHEATKNLRKNIGETNFAKWVPFIHLGV
ncbi:TPR-like protein [Gymnopus androsaceus JB14]|uniref:TPR-like protein n=1 Tax=Gymnopus androsaceus JB14 TaxID=1447944 RepID=A0A6A4GQC0_9AGAR|nr:TPR-like protein [Gymnopus androsaceus JB14]